MKKFLFLCMLLTSNILLQGQEIAINKSELKVKEPYKAGVNKILSEIIQLNLNSKDETDTVKLFIGNESTLKEYEILKEKGNKSFKNGDSLFFVKNAADIRIKISTNVFSDKDDYLILKFNKIKGEQIFQDTLTVTNTYPFHSLPDTTPDTTWCDPKRAELFIGTNFDLTDSKFTPTDWYGGVRVFLPNIFLRKKSNKESWGISGGIYQNKSMSDGKEENNEQSFYRATVVFDNNLLPRYYNLKFDTATVTQQREIKNFGMYAALIHTLSHYQYRNNFVSNIYMGLHAEVIRRNYTYSYTIVPIGSKTIQVPETVYKVYYPQVNTIAPATKKYVFYDAYFGAIFPIQFIWKDILEMKISPCLGVSVLNENSNTNSNTDTNPNLNSNSNSLIKPFYLVQFDLFSKLGGINLNLGGEVRGLFPSHPPIITAYLGTSFTIDELKKFISK